MSFGSGPIGSGPFASGQIRTTGAFTSVNPTSTNVVFTGYIPSVNYSISGPHVSQFSIEALAASPSDTLVHVSTVIAEVIGASVADSVIRISSVVAGVINTGTLNSPMRVSQYCIEALCSTTQLYYTYLQNTNLSGSGTLVCDARFKRFSVDAALNGTSSVTASIGRYSALVAPLTGSSSLTATTNQGFAITAPLVGSATLVCAIDPLTVYIEAALSGNGILNQKVKRLSPDGIENNSGYIHLPSIVRRDI
jgi:hypothetical protein